MPGARYEDWTHVRIQGDRNAAAPYLPAVRKLLGYLAQQRALGGPRTQVIRRTLGDGTYLEARFEGEIPIVEIITHAAEKALTPAFLDGFVVAPGGFDPVAFNEVLLQPSGRDNWSVFFFSAEETPVDYPTRSGIYSKANDRPLLDAPAGLKHAGNVDWRNRSETLSVSWAGPASRYFNDGGDRDTYVYYKGAVLFDIALYNDALFGGGSSVVNGACLAKHDGLTLIVALRRAAGFPSFSDFDTFIAVPLRIAEGYSRPASGKLEEVARLEAAIDPEHPEDAIVILLDREDPNLATDEQHPWMFNQAGTQARCMRPDHNTTIYECIVDVALDDGTAIYSELTEAWPVKRTVVQDVRSYAPVRIEGTFQSISSINPPSSGPVGAVRFLDISTDADKEYEWDLCVAYSTVTTVTSQPVRCAVDFRDDLPVYANATGENWTATDTGISDRASSFVSLIDGFTTATHPSTGATNCLASLDTSGVNHEESSWEVHYSKTGSLAGLQTDWRTLARIVDNRIDETGSATLDHVWSNSQSAPTNPLIPPWGAVSASLLAKGSTLTIGSTQHREEQTSTTGYSSLAFLDLRYRWAVFQEQDNVHTTTVETTPLPAEISTANYANPGGAIFTEQSFNNLYYPTPGIFAYGYGELGSLIDISEQETTETVLAIERLRVTCGANDLAVLETYRSEPDPAVGSAALSISYRATSGTVLKLGTFQSPEVHSGRSPEDFLALTPLAPHEVDADSDTSGTANWFFDSFPIDGSWQAYHDHYCYSLRQQMDHGAVYSYLRSVGRVETGQASAFSLAQLTGYIDDPQIFYPVSILTPTAAR